LKPITLREATTEDWPVIVALHVEHQKAQGTNYELPYLFGPQIAIALVGMDEAGKIHNCIYVEAVAEMRFIGCNAKATAFSMREIHGLAYVLKLKGFRWLECYVPRKLKRLIQKPLQKAGFSCADRELSHFTRDLRDKE
jgi:hypothetical protein